MLTVDVSRTSHIEEDVFQFVQVLDIYHNAASNRNMRGSLQTGVAVHNVAELLVSPCRREGRDTRQSDQCQNLIRNMPIQRHHTMSILICPSTNLQLN